MIAAKASNGGAGDIVAAVYDRRTFPGVASSLCDNRQSFRAWGLASAFVVIT